MVEIVQILTRANNDFGTGANRKLCFSSDEVKRLVVDFDVQQLAARPVKHRVLITGHQVVLAVSDCELWEDSQICEAAVGLE